MDKITHKKRKEILKVIDNFLNDKNLKDALDIGTTEDTENPSSNFHFLPHLFPCRLKSYLIRQDYL